MNTTRLIFENQRKVLPSVLFYSTLGYFTYLMVLITIQYVPINFEVAFLRIKSNEIFLRHYQYAFFIHVYSSIFLLIAGFTQFSNYLRIRFVQVHRKLGMGYVLIILLLASPSGLVMAYYANGGFYAKLSFGILAVLWFVFTFLAFYTAKAKNWSAHRDFMLRSFALTLSAISLRLFKWIIVSTLALPPMDTYRIVAWAGWLVNLIAVEVWIRNKKIKPN